MPEEGSTKTYQMLNYEPLEKSIAQRRHGKVFYEAVPHWIGSCETSSSVTLYWDLNRREWLAKVEGEFLEGYEMGEQVFLPFSRGPYALNDSARKKLFEAYQIPEASIKLDKITNTSPEQFRKISGHVQGD